MAPEKETIMVLKVDLQCPRCYKKIKKVLCKFPQIRDQVYNQKQNTVTIKVVCCSPETTRDKLYIEGGKSILSIEIIKDNPPPPKKQKPPPPPPPQQLRPPPPPPPQQPRPPPPPPPQQPRPPPPKQPITPPPPQQQPQPTPPPPPTQPMPRFSTCCEECHQGQPGGPCYSYVRPWRPICDTGYDPYYYHGGGGGGGWWWNSTRPCYCCPCHYLREENQQGCFMM